MKKFMNIFCWSSLKEKLLAAFIVTSVIPSFVLILFSYINTSHIVKNNAEGLIYSNLQQTKSSLDVWMDSYEDILFQIYMNDDIVDMVDSINNGEEVTIHSTQLRKTLRGLFYPKEHMKCITIITDSGNLIFYDLLTGSLTKPSWIGNIGMSNQEIYDYFSSDNMTHMIPTKQVGTYATDTYYLFHLGHRIIDYQDVNKKLGVVFVSIDETMLQDICGEENNENTTKFMVDTNGTIISCADKAMIGQKIIEWDEELSVRQEKYNEFLLNNGLQDGLVKVVYDEEFGVDIVSVSNQKELFYQLNVQQKIMLFALMLTAIILLLLIIMLTKKLMYSINQLVKTMKIAEKGQLSIRMEIDQSTPMEIQIIEKQFNHMMDELEVSIRNEKEALNSQRKAEIATLEAQINPHFLYNTLDTINWMAIDKDEYEISNSITSLAYILRYGIDNSNGVVTISKEVEWLKQYLFLQQTRLKNTFECNIDVSPEVWEWKIHKLIFQPFVENSIFHGFKVEKELYILNIVIQPQEDQLMIRIWDNGVGIQKDLLDRINDGEYPECGDKNSIGMKNAINRIKMYYGENSTVIVDSCVNEYTCVEIYIPKIVNE